jgi:uncharacterized repeat protein (TIGR03806 family)
MRRSLQGAVFVGLSIVAACQLDESEDTSVAAARIPNPSCIAGPRPTTGSGVQLVRAFPTVTAQRPIALVPIPGTDRWVLAEQAGRLRRVRDGAAAPAPTSFADLTDRVDASAQETGLLGFAFHPQFPSVPRAFASYTARKNGQLVSRISRFTASTTSLDRTTEQVVLEVVQPFDNHNGGHIAFGRDGFLYIGLGDGGGAGDPTRKAQRTDSLFGKLLRIDVDSGTPYGIPADNPFANGGGRREIYALGFRNPWRFSVDRATGEIWLGDVGQDQREEIDRVERGGNYGWSLREGDRCFRDPPACNDASFRAPIAVYGRSEGISVTGGFVYRGTAIPGLVGAYVYGDFGSGTIWGLFADAGTGQLEPRVLANSTGRQISSFAEGSDGELYVLDYGTGEIVRLVAVGSPTGGLPRLLSETGCVDPAAPWNPVSALVAFDVASPLWSDNADKSRFIALPDGQYAEPTEDHHFELPNGAVLVKRFARGNRRLETRLLMKHTDGTWAGYSYVWRADGSDAELADGAVTIATGNDTWRVPSRGECMQCHTAAGGRVLGFRVDQLNRTVANQNQLEMLRASDLIRPALPAASTLPALPSPTGAAPIAERARAYLDANCAHCHQPGGPGRGGFDLRYATAFAHQGVCDALPTVGDLGITGARLIAPGDPDRSVLWQRLHRRGLDQMPPLATAVADSAGSNLVRGFISALTECPPDVRRTVVFLRRPTMPGENLFLRGGIDHDAARDLLGRNCTQEDRQCAIPIVHRNHVIAAGAGATDTDLDWYTNSPTAWTTNHWPAAWGPRKTVAIDGVGEEPLNTVGPHLWMLDVDMDCRRTAGGWFEVKGFSVRGTARVWEPNIAQPHTPYPTLNHVARCGAVTFFEWGQAN